MGSLLGLVLPRLRLRRIAELPNLPIEQLPFLSHQHFFARCRNLILLGCKDQEMLGLQGLHICRPKSV